MPPGLRHALCPTRWTVQTGAIAAVLTNYCTLCAVLQEVNETGRDEYAMHEGWRIFNTNGEV